MKKIKDDEILGNMKNAERYVFLFNIIGIIIAIIGMTEDNIGLLAMGVILASLSFISGIGYIKKQNERLKKLERNLGGET